MSTSKLLAIINTLLLVLLILWNYYSNTGVVNDTTVGEVSNKFDSLFTPAGYTFSIWGVIYLGLLYQAVYFLRQSFRQDADHSAILKATPWLILANLANGFWLWFWLNEAIAISVVFIFMIFIFLMIAVFRLNMERWDAPVSYMAGVWWPIDVYVGWIAVASIANVAAYLSSIQWSAGFSEINWTVIMIIIGTVINLIMVFTRNMREFAAVGIWAFIGIAVRHWGEIPAIQWTAISCVVILFIVTALHAYKNRFTLPHHKIRRGEY